MADLLTDDMDIRDTILTMDVGGNGDYYLSLKETKKGKIIRLDTRIAMSGGNATTEVKIAVANLYKALQYQQVSGVLKVNEAAICPKCGNDNDCWYLDDKRLISCNECCWIGKNDKLLPDHGICKEKGCKNPATKDYNEHGHWVCDKCYDSLDRYFEEEYK